MDYYNIKLLEPMRKQKYNQYDHENSILFST